MKYREEDEEDVPGYPLLVRRKRDWGTKVCLRGHNITVNVVYGSMLAEGWAVRQEAWERDLDEELVAEALRYAEAHLEELDAETRAQNDRLREGGLL